MLTRKGFRFKATHPSRRNEFKRNPILTLERAREELLSLPTCQAHFPPRSPPFPPQRVRAGCARLKRAMSVCEICNGVGLVRVKSDAGLWVSRACECQEGDREEHRLAA